MNSKLCQIRDRADKLEAETWSDFWSLVVDCGSILKEILPNKRRAWLSHVIEEIYRDQQGLCALGGEPLTLAECTVDHKIPFCYGGGNERDNIQLACLAHNQQKGRRGVSPMEVLKYLEDRYMNR